jgi:hypothetical protein
MVAGVNAYLRKTGAKKLSDPTCRGKAHVRRITTMDMWLRFYQLGLRASSGNFADEILAAEPPGITQAPVELEDGRVVDGILYPRALAEGRHPDISEFADWRAYRASVGSS